MPRYALVVGISEYARPLTKLSKPETDAETLAKLLSDYGDFQDVKLLQGKVSYKQLCNEILTFGQRADCAEAFIYFTGHGFAVTGGLGGIDVYLATSDCVLRTDGNHVVGQEKGLSLNELNNFIQNSNISSLVMLLDCCHSGSAIEDSWIISTLSAMNRKNYYLLAACREFEQSWAIKSEQHSVFTSALVQGLSRENSGSDGKISCDSLFAFVKNALKGSGQEPISLTMGGNITLVSYPSRKQVLEDFLLCQRNPATISEGSNGTKIMELKMKVGGVSESNIDYMRDCAASAETISISWLKKYADRKDKAIAQYEHIQMITRTECVEAYNSTRNPAASFGDEMFTSVWQKLRQMHVEEREKLFGCRFEHLLGFTGILTEECKVWWSEPFDIPEDLRP